MQELRRVRTAEPPSAARIKRMVLYSNRTVAVRCSSPSVSIREDEEASPQQGPTQYKTGRTS